MPIKPKKVKRNDQSLLCLMEIPQKGRKEAEEEEIIVLRDRRI